MASERKRVKRDDRIEEVLAAARQLLETQGLVGTSVAEVASLAKVSEATVFSYFGTRRDLMFRVISDWMEPVIARLEIDVKLVEGTLNRLNFFATRHLYELAAAPGLHQLIYRELHWDSYYGSLLHKLNQRYARVITWIIEQGKRDGEVKPDTDQEITRDMMFGTLHHVGWRTFMNNRPLDIGATAETIAKLVYGGIAIQEARSDQADRLEAAIAKLVSITDHLER